MDWFQKLERKYSKYAIQNLMMYIIVLYAVGFVFEVFAPGVYSTYLSLDFAYIFKGQIWRLVTFIIQPPSTSIIFVFFSLYFYYLIGTVLENIWGSFKFNVYFFSGVILNIIAALIIYLIFGISFNMSTHYINLALFMAFAMEQPDMEVLLFFVIPIKIKWMALLDGIVFAIIIYLLAVVALKILSKEEIKMIQKEVDKFLKCDLHMHSSTDYSRNYSKKDTRGTKRLSRNNIFLPYSYFL